MPGDAFTIWITGLPTAGKSALASGLAAALRDHGLESEIIDSGKLRSTPLGCTLGFSRADRDTNARRHALAARLLVAHDVVAIVAAVSPYRDTREAIRKELGRYFEIYAATPKGACIDRDDKGLWAAALGGSLPDFTGVDAPYEPPLNPEISLDLSQVTVSEAVVATLTELTRRGLLDATRSSTADEHEELAARLHMVRD